VVAKYRLKSESDERLRVQRPLNYDFEQAGWRSRLVDIDADLNENGQLSREFRAVRGIDDQDAAEGALNDLLERHRELLPGDGGRELARSIIRDSPPRPRRVQLGDTLRDAVLVDIFAEPVSPYTSRTKRAGGKRYSARTLRQLERTRQTLALLRGDDGHPRIRKEVARIVYPNDRSPGRALNTELHRLTKQRGIRFRPSFEQKIVARFLPDPAAVRRWEEEQDARDKRNWRRRSSKTKKTDRWIWIPAACVSYCTSFSASKLCAAGYESVREYVRNADGAMTVPLTLIKIPRALLVIDDERMRRAKAKAMDDVELSRFLESLDPL
jgi:hypothetical protein